MAGSGYPIGVKFNGFHLNSKNSAPKKKRHRKSAIAMLRDHGQSQIRGPASNPKHLSDIRSPSATTPSNAGRSLLHGNILSTAIHASGHSNAAPFVSSGEQSDSRTVSAGAGSIQVPVTLDVDMLRGAAIVGQAASKFILLKSSDNTLLCVDQHAADERVQLEKLEVHYREAQRKRSWGHSSSDDVSVANGNISQALQVYTLAKPLVLRLLPQEEERVNRFTAELKLWKFAVRVGSPVVAAAPWHSRSDGSRLLTGAQALLDAVHEHGSYETHAKPPHKKMLIVSAVPMLFGIPLSVRDMRLYLQELCDRGAHLRSFRPSFVTRILNSLACKRAVKFGTKLDSAECRNLVRELAACTLPFQCAHGRPSVVPLATGGTLSSCLGMDWRRTTKRNRAESGTPMSD